ENEVAKYLEPDERNIPIIVNIAYQEILPLLYVLTRSIDIPCPAYKISQISQTVQPQDTTLHRDEELQTKSMKKENEVNQDDVDLPSEQSSTEEAADVLDELEKLVEGQNVSPN